jgi:hypothetical protein
MKFQPTELSKTALEWITWAYWCRGKVVPNDMTEEKAHAIWEEAMNKKGKK